MLLGYPKCYSFSFILKYIIFSISTLAYFLISFINKEKKLSRVKLDTVWMIFEHWFFCSYRKNKLLFCFTSGESPRILTLHLLFLRWPPSDKHPSVCYYCALVEYNARCPQQKWHHRKTLFFGLLEVYLTCNMILVPRIPS